ncbi:hypothetical protein V2W45_1212846, partial [Cenococcum geophilum]
ALPKHERKAYTDAVTCLQSKAARLDLPGTKHQFDDFCQPIKYHCYYVWTYETVLREECGYEGYQPSVVFSANSPVFDGSPYSVSGNSVSITHGNGSSDWTSHGLGGECVKEGPFGNMTVKLGPV